ncbi:MAG TPA: hypothetical protein VMP11_00345 [Verrucomicrobiae bacterium]|nr:hypothetical protein [Verrucomicrobiae bacterium]
MNARRWICRFGLMLVVMTNAFADASTEKVRNDKVVVMQVSLAPGEGWALPRDRAGVVVYLDDGSVASTMAEESSAMATQPVKRGDVVFRSTAGGLLKNDGLADLRFVYVEFLGAGRSETWGSAGLAPGYKVLVENQYVRVYDIRFAAGTSEPKHTHHDRVVVCLSGAELEHELPDGRRETSTLKTGEIAWRRGGTHIGHNIGKTDLWVIAIEPK